MNAAKIFRIEVKKVGCWCIKYLEH